MVEVRKITRGCMGAYIERNGLKLVNIVNRPSKPISLSVVGSSSMVFIPLSKLAFIE